MLLSLALFSSCDSGNSSDESKCSFAIEPKVYVMDSNAETEVVFIVNPPETDISKIYLESIRLEEIPANPRYTGLELAIKSITKAEKPGYYIATLGIYDTRKNWLLPSSGDKYELNFVNCCLSQGVDHSIYFGVQLMLGIETQE